LRPWAIRYWLLYHEQPYNEIDRKSARQRAMQPNRPGRILALDYGRSRIGLAVSDELGLTAQGLETLERKNIREDLARLAALAQDRAVSLILMGDPMRLSGQAGSHAEEVRRFGRRLEQRTGIPVCFWDERLTTVEANRLLRQAGADRSKRRQAVDRISAVLLLQSYLDWRAGQVGQP